METTSVGVHATWCALKTLHNWKYCDNDSYCFCSPDKGRYSKRSVPSPAREGSEDNEWQVRLKIENKELVAKGAGKRGFVRMH